MWPSGPRYEEWVEAVGWRAWVLFKLRSADWYLDRLEEVGGALGFDRFVGVEMAMDAALGSINGAFDAAVAAVIDASQRFEKQAADDAGEQTPGVIPEHLYKWERAKEKLRLAAQLNLTVDPLIEAVESALHMGAGDAGLIEATPPGWLQQMRRLRNRTVHHSTLPRTITIGDGETNLDSAVWGISVGGRGEDPVAYLRTALQAVKLLVSPMLEVCDYLAPLGIPTSGATHLDSPIARTVAPDEELHQLVRRMTD